MFAGAAAVTVEGFENGWNAQEPVVKPGPFLHVERTSLADAALAFVIARGAYVHDVHSLPSLGRENPDGISVTLDGHDAGSSPPLMPPAASPPGRDPSSFRAGTLPSFTKARRAALPWAGGIISDQASPRWAYRAGLSRFTTVGVVGCTTSRKELDPSLAQALDVPAAEFRFAGRRASFPQWAAQPALGRRLSVGDAAFASDPLAGQGIRFAMASGIAAATAVDTLARSANPELALAYYRDFVHSARRRHLQTLDRLRGTASPPVPEVLQLPDTLQFTAHPRLGGAEHRRHTRPRRRLRAPRRRFCPLARWVRPPSSSPPCHGPNSHHRPLPETPVQRPVPLRLAHSLTWCVNHNLLSPASATDN